MAQPSVYIETTIVSYLTARPSRDLGRDARCVCGSCWCEAGHIATAAAYGIDYLLTWNCKHIANAAMLRALTRVCSTAGYELPVLCTPEQLVVEE